MKEVERINVVIVNPNQQAGFMPRYDSYAIDMDKERNCYNCGDFGYITRHCKKRENQKRIEQERRVNDKDNKNISNVNRKKNLIVLD